MPDFDALLRLAQEDPAQFKKLMAMAQGKTIVPHSGQQVVLDSDARFKVMNCGRRWGKTVLAAKIILSKSRQPRQMLWWVAPTYKVVKRGYDEVLRQIPEGVLAKPAPPSSNFDAGRAVILRFKNGTMMEFYSAERPEGMLGAAVDYAVLDEAAIMPARIWNQIVSPTLIDNMGGALMISTPRGRNWFYKVWQKGQGLDPLWASWTFTTQDNPTLPPGEADRMAADLPRTEADQEIFARWLAAGSSVFLIDPRAVQETAVLPSGLIEGISVRDHFVVMGVDLARKHDWTVLYGARAKDRRNCFFERMQGVAWEEQRRRIKRSVRMLQREGATGVLLMVDEGNGGNVIVEDLQEAGYDVIGINFSTHKSNMVRLLANDLERGRAFILDDPTGVNEFESYLMDITPGGRFTYSAPDGDHDDIVSAKMLQHYGLVNEGVPELTVITGHEPLPVDPSSGHAIDPWNPEYDPEEDDYGDLLDEVSSLTPEQAAAEVGAAYRDPMRPPSPQELLNRPELWFG